MSSNNCLSCCFYPFCSNHKIQLKDDCDKIPNKPPQKAWPAPPTLDSRVQSLDPIKMVGSSIDPSANKRTPADGKEDLIKTQGSCKEFQDMHSPSEGASPRQSPKPACFMSRRGSLCSTTDQDPSLKSSGKSLLDKVALPCQTSTEPCDSRSSIGTIDGEGSHEQKSTIDKTSGCAAPQSHNMPALRFDLIPPHLLHPQQKTNGFPYANHITSPVSSQRSLSFATHFIESSSPSVQLTGYEINFPRTPTPGDFDNTPGNFDENPKDLAEQIRTKQLYSPRPIGCFITRCETESCQPGPMHME